MLKIILFLLTMFVAGFLLIHENWYMTISGFGYEVTLSTVLLIIAFFVLLYVISLLKKPFSWIFGWKSKRASSHFIKKEAFLTFVLETILDQNNNSIDKIFKQKNNLFPKKDAKHLLLTAIFNPAKEVFQDLSQHKSTQLAGLRGLYLYAKENGNLKEQERLLLKIQEEFPTVFWVIKEKYEIEILQNDWENALNTLETLYKEKQIEKDEYTNQKAAILFTLGKIKEAYNLNKTNPAFAVAFAKTNPQNAKNILSVSWNKEPSWEVYLAYKDLFKNDSADKQIKAVNKLIAKNKDFRISMLALADTAIKLENWRLAKDTLENYLQSYPLTKKVASLMAEVARKGWHHEQEAKEWEDKGLESDDKYGWFCTACNHTTASWSPSCPHCNKIGKVIYR